MKTKIYHSFLLIILSLILLVGASSVAHADNNDASSSINRFNVVVVLDASNSMNYTDPSEVGS